MGKLLSLAIAALSLSTIATAVIPLGNSAEVPCTDVFLTQTACPDLIVDPAKLLVQQPATQTFSTSSCDVQEGTTQPGARNLMRFYQSTPNIGLGDLKVGVPSQHPEWFYYAPCHRHYHFREYSDYRLWTPEQYGSWKQLKLANPTTLSRDLLAAHPELTPVAGNKGGFCVIDLFPYIPALTPLPQYNSCGNQGISAGWADEYVPGLSGQYIDVTDVAPGVYILDSEVNAEHLFVESDYTNNDWAVPAVVG
jgi:lysyl oxidase